MFLPRDAMHKRGYCRHAVSVRLSVTFVSCAKTNKDIFEFFFTIGQPSHSSFSIPFRREPRNGGVECKGGMKKMTIFDQYLALSQKRL